MNKYIKSNLLFAVLMAALCFVVSGCGGDDDPIPEPTPIPTPTPTPTPVVQKIDESSIDMDTEDMNLIISVQEQKGGRAVLTAAMETKGATTINIVGKYDSKNGCYVFDLSKLEVGKTYSYKVAVYNASGQKVMESDELSIVVPEPVPESADTDKEGTGGGSEGMRGGTQRMIIEG